MNSMGDWLTLGLLIFSICLFFFSLFSLGKGFAHWYNHKFSPLLNDGKWVTWQRADGIEMIGFKCDRCGKITHIEPQAWSYAIHFKIK